MKGKYEELAEVDPYDHFFEVYDEFDELKDRVFWDEAGLKYERHRPGERSTDILRIETGLRRYNVEYRTVGGPELFGGEDVEPIRIESVSLGGESLEQVVEDLERAAMSERVCVSDTSPFLRHVADLERISDTLDPRMVLKTATASLRQISSQTRESVPPENYMDV